MKRKLSLLVMLILALSIVFALPVSANTPDGFYEGDDGWYFYRDGVMVTDEIIEYGDYLYAFNEWGRMYDNTSFWVYTEYESNCYRAKPGGALCVNEWYWQDWEESWYYYGENGVAPQNEFMTVNGTLYYFEHNGRMFVDGATSDWMTNTVYAFDQYGACEPIDKSTVGWQWKKGNWYYVYENEYGVTELAYRQILNINGTNYLFGDNYAMATNEFVCIWDYENYENIYYYADAYGSPCVGWIQPYANETDPDYSYRKDYWYYFGSDGKALKGYNNVNGTDYYFYDDGRMATNSCGIVEYTTDYAWSTDKNGIASYTYKGWLKVRDSYRYFDGTCWLEGLQEIDGSYYYFLDEEMLDNGSFGPYRAKAGGRLYQSEWYEQNGIWYYYDYQCEQLTDTVVDLYGNGVYYAFNSWGEMVKDEIHCDDFGNTYILDKNGAGALVEGTGWYAVNDRWVYAEDGNLVYDGWKTIDGSDYYFEDYYILQNTWVEDCLLSAGGAKITTEGWHIVDGEYYYVKDSSGTIAYGWYEVGGQYYYFYPSMAHNTVVEDYESGYVYGFDTNGAYFQVTGDGFYTSRPGNTMYIKNNVLSRDTWEYINGYWYYFDESGYKSEGPNNIDDTLYLFDTEGRLVYNSWCDIYGDVYRSNAAGVVLTGYQYVDGKYYLFDEDLGKLLSGGVQYQDGYTYLLYKDGSVYGYDFTPNTWYDVDGEWYYFDNGYFLSSEIKEIGGYVYAFDYAGQMITDEYDFGYYFDNAGHKLVNAWQNTPEGYMYFDENGHRCSHGYYTIDGNEYYFETYLKIGTFRDYNRNIVSTTEGGAVISKTPMSDGWTYADGKFHYVVDGNHYYNGFVGPYYVSDGAMVYNNIVTDNGKRYYIDTNGLYINSGWYNIGSDKYPMYIYANSDGSLKNNEWAEIGGIWYYFNDVNMIADCTYDIDGEYHKFAESGAWLGKVDIDANNGYANGWVYIDGDYYYSYNGRFLEGPQFIGGVWYHFGDYDDNPRMLADEFDRHQYYTASGALFEGTGWHIINGYYVYFDGDSYARTGLIEVGGTKYYISAKYINEDTDDEKYTYYMVSNGYVAYDGELYYANAGGALSKVANPNGWYWVENGQGYVYYQNGVMLEDGEHVINGVTYYFDESGRMASDDWYGYSYYDASGAKVTGSGWYWSDNYNGWIYVNNGRMYRNGLYYIGGVAYYFSNGVWVQ